jgi:L-histidine N-alpha-methyltransferase
MTDIAALTSTSFADDVRHYLQLAPRQLPSRYLYDALGSALFDAICELPWYGITRAENRLLARHRDEIFGSGPDLRRIVELGPGDGRKLLTLVERTSSRMTAHLVDVSHGALERAAHTLSDAANLSVVRHQTTFEDGLAEIARLPGDGSSLVLFLGSNIGNYDYAGAHQLLRRIHNCLGRDGVLVIGVDLVKPESDLQLAYDDPLGVSAAFNLNVLLRINRELGGNFDIRAFRHRAVWNKDCSRMEMFVVSTERQRVRIEAIDLDLELDAGESIWTESSYKYTPAALNRQLECAGLEPVAQWIDRDDAFALAVARTI